MRHNPRHHWDHWEEPKEGNQKKGKSSKRNALNLLVHACNSHHEWLILFFEIGSNMFKLLCIKVIFIHNILFLIDDWCCHFILKA